ncbi:hypothetical protein [Jidongwangia harbinensis]|uniref:hypothetical protein n=1 Tax=Jidongwangia harbinensis TaxID=2878561 RepID=UPI001CD95129|nr:hypothetical protein [Jidongwangia harbinensis]MCA2214800.1 hypothetical protein [Jidongwangia harbinensis]
MKPVVALAATAAATALGVRVARSRHRRFLHPDGRSFSGLLDVWGAGEPTGSALIDRPGRHPVTVRVSKGAGTRPGRADVLGLALRVHGPGAGQRRDLLWSTAGRGRWSRHVPVPRPTFDTWYGSIMAYRTGSRRKVYLAAQPDPDGAPWGRTLESVVAAAARDGARLVLSADDRPFGRVTLDSPLPAGTDAALAFDPIRNTTPDLHPSGAIHGVRAFAYRIGQRWRGARPADADPDQVARAFTRR